MINALQSNNILTMKKGNHNSRVSTIVLALLVLVLIGVVPEKAKGLVMLIAVIIAAVVIILRIIRNNARVDVAENTREIMLSNDDPVQIISRRDPAQKVYKIPTPPKGFEKARWIGVDETVEIAGLSLRGGLFYYGIQGLTDYGRSEPSLIDPSKHIGLNGHYTERLFGYWPSYSDVSAEARRAYLAWMAGNRQDPAADIGYVFIFFYGLERRVIVDILKNPNLRGELPIIEGEIQRLLDIYGKTSGSFLGYANGLLELVYFAKQIETDKLYLKPIPKFSRTYDIPFYIRLALGQASADGAHVNAELALEWIRHDPNTYLRTPATRCDTEFAALFEMKFKKAFPDGMPLPQNKTKLKYTYRPASSGLAYEDIALSFGELPDVTVLARPIKSLQLLGEEATIELESFSRFLGRNPASRYSFEGYLQLPACLWPQAVLEKMSALETRMSGGFCQLTLGELLQHFGAKTEFTRERILALGRSLEARGIGMEPDVIAGARTPKLVDTLVLFLIPPGEVSGRATAAYQSATLTLQLAATVAAADGEFSKAEMDHLVEHVRSWSHIAQDLQVRLTAHLQLLAIAPISLAALKKKIESLDAAAREHIAQFMTVVAQTDGVVTAPEVKALERIYKALGVESAKVFSDLHTTPSRMQQTAAVSKSSTGVFVLDPEKIASLQKDTAAVAALLAKVFTDEDTSPPVSCLETEEEPAVRPKGLLGLGDTYSSFARTLISRMEWAREELEDVAADQEIMLEGAIEILNDAAFEKYDIPFTDGDNPVMINPELLEKLHHE